MKYLITLFAMIAALNAKAQNENGSQEQRIEYLDAEDYETEVTLELYENQDIRGELGFTVFIYGWKRNDQVILIGVSPTQEEILLLEEGTTLPTTENGTLQFSIPYSHEKLYPGKWILAVNGGSGMHGHIFNVPDPKESD